MNRCGYWLLVEILFFGTVANAQQQTVDNHDNVAVGELRSELQEKPQSQDTAGWLNQLVVTTFQDGETRTSLSIAEQAYRFAKRALGDEDPNTLISIINLASLYQFQGRYREAEALLQQALAVSEKTLGPEHPRTLVGVNNLASLYQHQGRYAEAEPLYQRALTARESTLGSEHPDTLISVNNLAGLYQVQGRYQRAEPLYQQALASRERILGSVHPDTLLSVNNIAFLYRSQGRYAKAEPLYRRALTAREKLLGPDHTDTLISVDNLADLYQAQGRSEKAEPLYLRTLIAREKTLGPEHPQTLRSVNNLAYFYKSRSRYREAAALYGRVLGASEKVLGTEHPQTLSLKLAYSLMLVTMNQPAEALDLLVHLEPHLREFAGLRLPQTRRQRVQGQALDAQSTFQDVALTLALENSEMGYLNLAAAVMLRWKQIQHEEDAALARLRYRQPHNNVEARRLAEKIMALRRELNHLAHQSESNTELLREKLGALEAEEIRLGQLSQRFERHLKVRSLKPHDVRSHLPGERSALLELSQYRPVDFATGEFGQPRWAALLLPAKGDVSLHDLGEVSETERLWQALRETGSEETAAALYENLFGELDERLKNYETLYLAPDTSLNLLPFARLVTPDGRYWIERQMLRQVTTGRHLVADYDEDLAEPEGMLVMGGTDQDTGSKAAAINKGTCLPAESPLQETLGVLGGKVDRFSLLRETDGEGIEVVEKPRNSWGLEAQLRLDASAAEAHLKSLTTPPMVLQLTTDGFHLDNENGAIDRPIALSGIALAGAGPAASLPPTPNAEDGILYTPEVQALNLENTELVALSTCDTGLDKPDDSDTIHNLVRAFRVAGARYLLVPLWQLKHDQAQEFMTRFYQTWLNGNQPLELGRALRDTQLSFIEDDNERLRNPEIWGSFLLVAARL